MYHIVPEVRLSTYITVHWVCHGVVRLVSSNGYIYYFHGREFGFTRWFITLGLPRCREVGFMQRLYIISTVVRSGLPDGLLHWVFHGVVRLVSSNSYILFPRQLGRVYQWFITLVLPRCREVGFIQQLYIIFTAVRSSLPDGLLLSLLP